MSRLRSFCSWLAPHFERFVALKRASGASYVAQENLLLAFDRYVCAKTPEPPLRVEAVIHYLASLACSPRAQDNVVSVVWQSLSFARRHDGRVEALPERPPKPPRYYRQRQPRIVSAEEVGELLVAARQMPPLNILRPATMATLIGLLYATGIRIGEALALNIADLDPRESLLTVVRGKFGKSRVLPLRESTSSALVHYIEEPRRPIGTRATAPIFVSSLKRRLAQPTASGALKAVCQGAEISKPWPRPHDFRHTFAISRVAAWYTEGRNLESLLPILSTYLGHSSVENTRLYLTANGALLEQASARFAHQTRILDEVST